MFLEYKQCKKEQCLFYDRMTKNLGSVVEDSDSDSIFC